MYSRPWDSTEFLYTVIAELATLQTVTLAVWGNDAPRSETHHDYNK